MRQECYDAENWLNRNYNKAKQLEADKRMLEVMGDRLGAGVAKYESDGTESHDPDAARARHEDTLLEYSEQRAKVEKDEKSLISETLKTRRAIGELSDGALQAVAIDRYINRLRWSDIAKLEHISIAQVYRMRRTMLEQMVEILKHFNFT